MKVLYTSPVFKDANGEPRKFMIPLAGLKTHQKRDACLLKMLEMGGIHARPTPEFLKLRNQMLNAKRKIQREGWFSETVLEEI